MGIRTSQSAVLQTTVPPPFVPKGWAPRELPEIRVGRIEKAKKQAGIECVIYRGEVGYVEVGHSGE